MNNYLQAYHITVTLQKMLQVAFFCIHINNVHILHAALA